MITVGITYDMLQGMDTVSHLQDIYTNMGARTEIALATRKGFYYEGRLVGFRRYKELLERDYTDILILVLNKDDILSDKHKNMQLDAIIVMPKALETTKGNNAKIYKHKLFEAMNNYKYAIIPASFITGSKFDKSKHKYITYGVGRNAMVSASSVEMGIEGDMLLQCCIRSGIETFEGNNLEEQEFAITTSKGDLDVILVSIATLLLHGLDSTSILSKYKR